MKFSYFILILLCLSTSCQSVPTEESSEKPGIEKTREETEREKAATAEIQRQERLKKEEETKRMERIERDRREKERLEKQKQEAQRLENERLERERQRREREENARLEQERRLYAAEIKAIRNEFYARVEAIGRARSAITEEFRRKERAQRIEKEDPERQFFWRREFAEKFGRELTLILPQHRRILLCRQTNAAQFQGFAGIIHPLRPNFAEMVEITEDAEIQDLLTSKQGNWILLAVDSTRAGLPALTDSNFAPLRARLNGDYHYIINIYSNGRDYLRVEAEREVRPGQSGDYFVWDVDSIRLQRD